VQVEPIKLTVKAPRSKRLKLKCDVPLSNFAFNFNLRRYNMAMLTYKWFIPTQGPNFPAGAYTRPLFGST